MKNLIQLLKIAALVAVAAIPLFPQNTGQNVVITQMNSQNCTGFSTTGFTQIIASGTTFTSNALRNIGQTSHIAQVQIIGATDVYAVTGGVQGSIDNSHWFFIGPASQTSFFNLQPNQTQVNFSGYRNYPFIRTTFTITPQSGTLLVSITYVGNSSPSNNLVDQRSTDISLQYFSANIDASMTMKTPLTPAFAGLSTAVYSLSLQVPSTVTDVIVGCSDDGGTNITRFLVNLLAVNSTLPAIWPSSLRPYIACDPNTRLWLFTAGTGTLTITGTFRYE